MPSVIAVSFITLHKQGFFICKCEVRTVTQLSIPTHAQLHRHRLKFIKNHLKKLLHVSVFDHLQGVTMSSLKSQLLLTTVGCFYAKSGDVAACRVVCIGLYLKSA